MIQNVGYLPILYGLLFHPYKERPIRFLKMKFYKINFFKNVATQLVIKKAQMCLMQHLQALDKHLKKMKAINGNKATWICGNKFTLADITWMPLLHRLFMARIGFVLINEKCNTNVYIYWKRLQKRPSYKNAILNYENRTNITKKANSVINSWLNDTKNNWFKDVILAKDLVRDLIG